MLTNIEYVQFVHGIENGTKCESQKERFGKFGSGVFDLEILVLIQPEVGQPLRHLHQLILVSLDSTKNLQEIKYDYIVSYQNTKKL